MNRYTFSGHESFPLKTMWLKKGYDFVVSGNDFNSPDAVVRLGVGKNMVSSIKYWMRVCGVFDGTEVTSIGDYLFDDECGRDRYLEDLATLQLIHFELVHRKDATLYDLLFCGLQRERRYFDKEQVVNYVALRLAEECKTNHFNENTVAKDVMVLLNNYCRPRKVQSNDDISSLLLDLDMLRIDGEGRYYFNYEGKRRVIKEIFLYALLRIREELSTQSISLEMVQDNIGLVFCMTEGETIDMLKLLSDTYDKWLVYSDVSGVRQVQFMNKIKSLEALDIYYE